MSDKKSVALIDGDGLLVGYDLKPAAEADAAIAAGTAVAVPENCDLALKRYRWTGKTFAPLTRNLIRENVKQEADALRAIANGLMAIRDGKPLPRVTLDWLSWYEKTVDNAGSKAEG